MQSIKRNDSGVSEKVIRFRTSLRNTVYDVMRDRGWKETDSETEWDFFWIDIHYLHEYYDGLYLREEQRINHFKNHYELTRKDLLVKNMNRIKKETAKKYLPTSATSIGSRYESISKSYVLPQEYGMFLDEYKRNPGLVWIMKPWKKTKLGVPPRDVQADGLPPPVENYLVQQYIDRPYLIGGKKFDIRSFALVTCWNPLTVYIHRHAFCRFSNSLFNMDDISNLYIHATNVAIQKTAPNYNKNKGSKWLLHNLKLYLTTIHGDCAVRDLFNAIEETMIRALVSVHKVMINDKHCFELYGYDILIDKDLRVWLLEINASPSLSPENQWDYDLKYGILNDMFDVIDMEGRPSGNPSTRVGGFDLVFLEKPVPHSQSSIYETYLGAYHPIKPTNRRRKSLVDVPKAAPTEVL